VTSAGGAPAGVPYATSAPESATTNATTRATRIAAFGFRWEIFSIGSTIPMVRNTGRWTGATPPDEGAPVR